MTETAKEYAVALFELAYENNSGAEYLEALKLILSEFDKNPEYLQLLSSPNIAVSERKELLENAFAPYVPEYVMSFTKLLCEKQHIMEFGRCVDEYEELYKASESVSNAHIISSVPLSDAEKTKLTEKLEKLSRRTIIPQYEIDETILGGIIIKMDDTIIDGSLKHKLKEVKEVIGK